MKKNSTVSNNKNNNIDNQERTKMTKAELIDTVGEFARSELGITKKATTEIANRLFDEMSQAIATPEGLSIHGLGKFETSEREHLIYPGVKPGDPRTGVTPVKEKRTHVVFRPSRGLKDSVNV